jgi:hypothetical protein
MYCSHFLLTRFNCPIRRQSLELNDVSLDERWLNHRFLMFESFCLPSVSAQDAAHFTWVLFVNARTPDRWLARLNASLRGITHHSVIIPVDAFSEARVVAELQKLILAGSEYVATTRLDNDDAIASNYLSSVHILCESMSHGGIHVINYVNGCQIDKSGIYTFSSATPNPFLTVLAPREGLKTAYRTNHTKIARVATVTNVKTEIMWMQVVHSNNALNRLIPNRPRLAETSLLNFPISAEWQGILTSAGNAQRFIKP